MVRAVVFDLGKVLLDFDYLIAARAMVARGGVSLEHLARFFSQSPILVRYETGLMTSDEFYHEFCAGTGFRCGFEEFAECFGDIFTPIESMIQLHAALRKRGFPTYIFSNTNDLAIRVIRRRFPFFANFDGYVFSYEHRAMKPHAKLYEVLEQMAGHTGPELLYLDDRAENVAGGAARGWQVILQENPKKTLRTIRKLGLL
jgi:glucose-1-phosphatase